jgi:hypothetical protein
VFDVLDEREASHTITADRLRAGAFTSVATTPMPADSVRAMALVSVATSVMLTILGRSTLRERVSASVNV